MSHEYVVIGTGPCGIAAAGVIREKEPDCNLTLIGDDVHGFYSRPGLAYFLTGEVSERQLSLPQAVEFRRINARAVALYPDIRQVTCDDGRKYNYDKLLLATGSSASGITNPGADMKGVVKLDSLDDTKEIISIAKKSKAAVVVGGGITALELVEGLVARGIETHYLLRSDRYWPNVLDEVESAIVEKRLQGHGVRIHTHSQIARIVGKQDKVIGVELEGGESIKCQIVAVAVGVQPRVELAKAAGLKTDRGILTDEYLQTSVRGVFAAGDAAQIFDPVSGKALLDALWGKALAQGRIAGLNMVGERTPYEKSASFNVTRLAGITTTIIGTVGQGNDNDLQSITRGDSETWRQLPNVLAVQWDSEVNRVRIVIGARTFIGAVVMGDQTLSHPLQRLIAGRVDISPLLPILSRPGVSLADAIIDYWSRVESRL